MARACSVGTGAEPTGLRSGCTAASDLRIRRPDASTINHPRTYLPEDDRGRCNGDDGRPSRLWGSSHASVADQAHPRTVPFRSRAIRVCAPDCRRSSLAARLDHPGRRQRGRAHGRVRRSWHRRGDPRSEGIVTRRRMSVPRRDRVASTPRPSPQSATPPHRRSSSPRTAGFVSRTRRRRISSATARPPSPAPAFASSSPRRTRRRSSNWPMGRPGVVAKLDCRLRMADGSLAPGRAGDREPGLRPDRPRASSSRSTT